MALGVGTRCTGEGREACAGLGGPLLDVLQRCLRGRGGGVGREGKGENERRRRE